MSTQLGPKVIERMFLPATAGQPSHPARGALILLASLALSAVPALAQPVTTQPVAGKYMGPASCAGMICHSSNTPRSDTRVLGNELFLWARKDKHRNAYNVLKNEPSPTIAKNLGLKEKAVDAPRCLACHTLHPPADQRGREFEADLGVSCERCHGPSSNWLRPHTQTTPGQTVAQMHAANVALGMYDTKNLVDRAERCLDCHLGTNEKFVDHELIAAGHPDLVFDMAKYIHDMPRHWKNKEDALQVNSGAEAVKNAAREDAIEEVRIWAVGQIVQLKRQMQRVADHAKDKIWPEYAELQCDSCHHSLTRPEQSWRQLNGFADRKAGNIPFDQSRYVVCRRLLGVLGAGGTNLDGQVGRLFQLMSTVNPDRKEATDIATRAAGMAEELVKTVYTANFDADTVSKLIRSIATDATGVSFQGQRAALEAVWALDNLTSAAVPLGVKINGDADAILRYMRVQLNDPDKNTSYSRIPSNYNGPEFKKRMQELADIVK